MIRALLAFVLLCCGLAAQQIILENVATEPQRAWTFCGLPKHMVPAGPTFALAGMQGMPAVPATGGVWLLADLPASTRVKAELQPFSDASAYAVPFEWHHAIDAIGLFATLPTFFARDSGGAIARSQPPVYWAPGTARPAGGFVRLLESDQAHQTWHVRTRIVERLLTFDWWVRVGSGTATLEWTLHVVYGDTRQGQPISVQLGSVGFEIGVEPVLDFSRRVGAPAATRNPNGTWTQVVMQPAPWGRAARVEARGALLVLPDPARKQQRPLGAVSLNWNGHWLAHGAVPRAWPGANALSARRLAEYMNPPAGAMYDQRGTVPELSVCQPKASGTTGEQPDFGASAGEEAVTQLNAWAIHWMHYHAQSFAMRPTANKEPNGDPVKAADHPRCVTYQQKPDDRLSDADPLGWYSPPSTGTIPFTWEGSGYSTSDSQHRADGVLHALCALTRDPALLSVVADHIELQKMDVQRSRGLDSPRGEGRVLLSNCNQFWLGFLDARTFIERTINACYEGAMMRSVPPEAPVKTLGGNETAKYGWNGADGRPIVGWQGWQETIAAIGFLAAHRMTGNQRARELALDISRTCVTECFYRWSGGGDPTQWWHVYATRWRSEAPGQAMPPGAFYPVQPNFDIWTDGAADYWTECSARIFLLLASPSEPAYAKALELAAAQPNGWQQARWWAVR